MLNEQSVRAVEEARFGRAGTFRRPLYGSYCFSGLPATLEFLLTGSETARDRALPADVLGQHGRAHRTVVLVVVDAFGWTFCERYADLPLLARARSDGLVSRLTAQFPSTTAAHLTTLHTGLPMGQTGVFEWNYFEPAVDAVISPLLFSLAGDHERETLHRQGVQAADLFPAATLYEHLSRQGVVCTVFQDERYARTTYSDWMFRGARVVPYASVEQAGDDLAACLLGESAFPHRYYLLYLDPIDGAGHAHGPDSATFDEAVGVVFAVLDRLTHRLQGKVEDAVLLLTADHGLTPLDPRQAAYVNWEVPGIERYLRLTGRGEPIRFGGGARDLFLYVHDDRLNELRDRLATALAGRAEVWLTRDLLAEGLFGPPPWDALEARLGNLVVLPYAGQAVAWYERGLFATRHHGSHGGLTPAEMDLGFFLLPL